MPQSDRDVKKTCYAVFCGSRCQDWTTLE